jgi:hypothetical protein
MAPYYYFLEDFEIEYKYELRYWITHESRAFLPPHLRNDDKLFKESSNLPVMMVPPNFYEKYRAYPKLFNCERPIFVIQNKYNSEWGGPPRNYFDLDLLKEIIEKVKNVFNIIYIRSNNMRMKEYSHDDNEECSFTLHDREMIREMYRKDVVLYEDLLQLHPTYDFNTLKCILLSQASHILSTIGGFNFFDAYFPCQHIIYKQETPEVYDQTFYQNQHNMLCPTPNEIRMFEKKSMLLEELALLIPPELSNS